MTKYCPDGQLIHTPSPKPREGLHGYLLRVSEENYYANPSPILELANIAPTHIPATPPLDRLAPVLGRTVEELQKLPWHSHSNGTPAHPVRSKKNHIISHLSIERPKICPQCVIDNGIVDAAWDLHIMVACPLHRVSLVDRCPSCHRPLSWLRPGLLHCQCGHCFAPQSEERIPELAIDLLRLIYGTLHELPVDFTLRGRISGDLLADKGIEELLGFLNNLTRVAVWPEFTSYGKRFPQSLYMVEALAKLVERRHRVCMSQRRHDPNLTRRECRFAESL